MGWYVLAVSLIVFTALLGFLLGRWYQAYLHQKDYEFYVEELAKILGVYRQANELIKSLRRRAEKAMQPSYDVQPAWVTDKEYEERKKKN